ncbi:hypothetical protein [Butyrivibrio sp. INlla21]|uniref:hypothetical protein n=1 Tax=Butyrivibrio sp. INlla21 TaxID=1520811 RepID=UPI0008F0F8D0|nr:hypothetical protein [Butyrivibrio sp. INlla21]SFV00508.1 hypothetical protein SAMN02910342_02889 [Butyrivibrio sp. INlla21]
MESVRDKKNTEGFWFCIFSLGCWILSKVTIYYWLKAPIVLNPFDDGFYHDDSGIIFSILLFMIVAYIFVIVVRKVHPDNKFGKVLACIYMIEVTAIVVIIIGLFTWWS